MTTKKVINFIIFFLPFLTKTINSFVGLKDISNLQITTGVRVDWLRYVYYLV